MRRQSLGWVGLVLLLVSASALSIAVGPGGITGAGISSVMNLRLLRLALGIIAVSIVQRTNTGEASFLVILSGANNLAGLGYRPPTGARAAPAVSP